MLERQIDLVCPRCHGAGMVTPKDRFGRYVEPYPCTCIAGRNIAACPPCPRVRMSRRRQSPLVG